MYCIECGKAYPDGARFCAYCGAKLFTPAVQEPEQALPTQAEDTAPFDLGAASFDADIASDAPFEADASSFEADAASFEADIAPDANAPLSEPEVEPEPSQAKPAWRAKEPFRARPTIAEAPVGRTLRPDIDNPAQPLRRGVLYAAEPIPIPEEEPLFPQDPLPEADLPPRPKTAQEKRAEKNTVLTATGEEELPARKPPVRREKRETYIPERIKPERVAEEETADWDEDERPRGLFSHKRRLDDEDGGEKPRRHSLFVQRPQKCAKAYEEDDELEREDSFNIRPKRRVRVDPDEYDAEESDERYVRKRVRRILMGIGAAVCLVLALWLFATGSGQVFLAGFGASGQPAAYRTLGDQAYANNQIKRAAEAYYRALALDPDDYETALLVGVTQQQIGNTERAANAYYMCTQLRPTEVEPYQYLVKLYGALGDEGRMAQFIALCKQNTGQTIS